jgi:hypothetical protein
MPLLPARWTLAAVAVVVALAVVSGSALASGHGHARAHRADTGASVTLVANVNDNDLLTVVSFQYGLTTSYGSTSASINLNALSISAKVSITLSGLTTGVTYHYRVVASNLLGTTYGPDQTFSIASSGSGSVGSGGTTVSSGTTVTASGGDTTLGTTVGSGGGGTTVGVTTGDGSTGSGTSVGVTLPVGTTGATGPTGATGSGATSGSGGSGTSAGAANGAGAGGGSGATVIGSAAPPKLQQTAVVTGASGTVQIQPPGAKRPMSLSGTSVDVPDGTLVILGPHSGVVDLTTALDTHGHTQTVLVWGGSFRLHYAHGTTGRVILSLAGGAAHACAAGSHGARAATARVARAKRSPARPTSSPHVVRSLWSSDNHGRYTTEGNDSVATVQGTVWLTEDRCDGTLTAVRRGAVLVTDKITHRSVRVTTGHSFLAAGATR